VGRRATNRSEWPALYSFVVSRLAISLLAVSFLAIFTTFARGASGDAPEITYRTATAEVRLTFSATDQRGHAIRTLGPRDFAVVDRDDVVRNFQSFARTEWAKLDLTMLVDASESVAPHYKQEIADALRLISQVEKTPDDESSVITFHRLQPALICPENCRASLVVNQISDVPANGLTPLFDGIVFAADLTSRSADLHTRKVLVLFSDGEDTISRHSAADAVAAALARDVQIYAVDLNPSGHSSEGTFLLQKLASATGGRYFTVGQGADKVYDAVLEDFHASYAVTYKLPGHAAGFHSVRILPTHNLGLHFHCRSGYEYSGRRN